jgi:hypothetical protein
VEFCEIYQGCRAILLLLAMTATAIAWSGSIDQKSI